MEMRCSQHPLDKNGKFKLLVIELLPPRGAVAPSLSACSAMYRLNDRSRPAIADHKATRSALLRQGNWKGPPGLEGGYTALPGLFP
jgi:hypothetical protein